MQLQSIQSILITRAVNAITFYKINASSSYENQARKEMNQHPPLYQHVTITVLPNIAKPGAEHKCKILKPWQRRQHHVKSLVQRTRFCLTALLTLYT